MLKWVGVVKEWRTSRTTNVLSKWVDSGATYWGKDGGRSSKFRKGGNEEPLLGWKPWGVWVGISNRQLDTGNCNSRACLRSSRRWNQMGASRWSLVYYLPFNFSDAGGTWRRSSGRAKSLWQSSGSSVRPRWLRQCHYIEACHPLFSSGSVEKWVQDNNSEFNNCGDCQYQFHCISWSFRWDQDF